MQILTTDYESDKVNENYTHLKCDEEERMIPRVDSATSDLGDNKSEENSFQESLPSTTMLDHLVNSAETDIWLQKLNGKNGKLQPERQPANQQQQQHNASWFNHTVRPGNRHLWLYYCSLWLMANPPQSPDLTFNFLKRWNSYLFSWHKIHNIL